MSVYAIGHAFQVHLPPREKFVLVALADNADHAGSCYPSLETLAGKTSMSVRTVQRALRDLETLGALVVERHGGRGRSSRYTIVGVPTVPTVVRKNPVSVSPIAAGKGDNESIKGDTGGQLTVVNRTTPSLRKTRAVGQSANGVGALIEAYQQQFEAKYQEPPLISRPKEPVLLAKLVKQFGEEKVRDRLAQFFRSDDKFIVGSGHSLAAFHGCFNKLIALSRDREPQPGYGKWG